MAGVEQRHRRRRQVVAALEEWALQALRLGQVLAVPAPQPLPEKLSDHQEGQPAPQHPAAGRVVRADLQLCADDVCAPERVRQLHARVRGADREEHLDLQAQRLFAGEGHLPHQRHVPAHLRPAIRNPAVHQEPPTPRRVQIRPQALRAGDLVLPAALLPLPRWPRPLRNRQVHKRPLVALKPLQPPHQQLHQQALPLPQPAQGHGGGGLQVVSRTAEAAHGGAGHGLPPHLRQDQQHHRAHAPGPLAQGPASGGWVRAVRFRHHDRH
mmetsp:Transcript_54277/g.126844  ORF Transcript_54277/g.126844 Transcript_54277/m.126844 type:complete len:268 (-) Transcript_54277:132-935(-)